MLFIQIPEGTHDLLVELFAPDSDFTIMKLCHPEILHSGSALSYNTTQAEPVLDAKDGTKNVSKSVDKTQNEPNCGISN